MPKNPKKEVHSGAHAHEIDLSEVERLLDFMQKHGLEEFEYERAGLHIRLKKPSARPRSETFPQPSAAAAAEPQRAQEPPAAVSNVPEDLHLIKSPIVGTFYSSPS